MSNPITLLPPNAGTFERHMAASVTPRPDTIPSPLASLWRPFECPVTLLPWLAHTLSVDIWNPDWSEAVKRQVIADSPDLHRIKGTPASLQASLDALGMSVMVQEWWQYGGQPYRFRVSVDFSQSAVDINTETLAEITRAALTAKNVRSHLDYIDVATRYQHGPKAVVGHHAVLTVTIPPAV